MLGQRSRADDGSIRRGSGEVQITSIELFAGSNPQPVKRFRTGDDVLIRLHYRAEKAVPNPVVGIEIEHLGGGTVTAPCSRDVGQVPDSLSGEGTIDISLGNVALLPGTFDLHTSVTDFTRSHIYDHLQVALRFDVMTGKPYEVGGLISMHPQWTIH